jgi:hypothetical protein
VRKEKKKLCTKKRAFGMNVGSSIKNFFLSFSSSFSVCIKRTLFNLKIEFEMCSPADDYGCWIFFFFLKAAVESKRRMSRLMFMMLSYG